MISFKDKNVIITGGSSGIGLSLAKKFAAYGANILIIARRKELLTKAVKEISKYKVEERQKIDLLSLDLTDHKKVQRATKNIERIGLLPDILINSAGVAHPGEFKNLDHRIFEWMMDVNYFGTVNIIQELLPSMLEKHEGSIVNISSISGFIGVYGYTAYSGSKYAVRGFSDVLRSELKHQGLHVAIVFPPDTDTPQLEYENQIKPEITKQIAGSAGSLNPDKVADEIINGINKKKYIILPGIESKVIYAANNILGRKIYPLMDFLVKKYMNMKTQ